MTWIPDGSPGFTIDGDIVTHVDEDAVDNVFNCMWQEGDGVSSGKHYWKIHFRTLDGGGGVGLTSKEHFGKGYRCKGLCFHGNLSDGSGLLVSNFGQSPVAGDTIGMLVSFEGARLKIFFDINGRSLGLAFNVAATRFTSVFPIVCFKHSGSATCVEEIEIPNLTKRVPITYVGIEGNWRLKHIHDPNTDEFKLQNLFVFLWHSPTTEIRKIGDGEYSWFTEVLNTFQTTLSITNEIWTTDSVFKTLIGGPLEVLRLEQKISNLMRNVKTVAVDDNGMLHIDAGTITSVWKRYNAALPRCFVADRQCGIM